VPWAAAPVAYPSIHHWPQTPLGSFQRSPKTPSWIWGAASQQGEGLGWGRGGEGEGKWWGGKGRAPKLLLNQGP